MAAGIDTLLKYRNQRGGALLIILISASLFGFMVAIAGTSWQTIMQRHKEQELLWRGGQIRSAICSYYNYKPTEGVPLRQFPESLNDLLTDSRGKEPVKHLRKLYHSPLASQDWLLLPSPAGGIMGVLSDSEEMPFKMTGFKKENKSFNGQLRYKDWHFLCRPTQTKDKKIPATNVKSSSLKFGAEHF